jgi:hypothetical protein
VASSRKLLKALYYMMARERYFTLIDSTTRHFLHRRVPKNDRGRSMRKDDGRVIIRL